MTIDCMPPESQFVVRTGTLISPLTDRSVGVSVSQLPP